MKLKELIRLIPYGTTTRLKIDEKLVDKNGLYLGTREVFWGRADDYILVEEKNQLDRVEVIAIAVKDGELLITMEDKERCLMF